VIAALEAAAAMKILSGNRAAVSPGLTVVDLWQDRFRRVHVARLCGPPGCPACVQGEFPWLAGRQGSRAAVLCGRNAVQLTRPGAAATLDELAERLQGVGRMTRNPFLLRLEVPPHEITLFADGRAIVHGTDDPATARSVYAKHVGN
jgi:adenylyltransferase/sulfurtransferase